MNTLLVFLTLSDPANRKIVLASLHRVPDLIVAEFETLAQMRKAMRSQTPSLLIGPWSQGGETMLAARATVAGNTAYTTVPIALVLTDTVSPARISLVRNAGSAELIPCAPLDREGLFNRVTLLLRGADALYDTLDENHAAARNTVLDNLPALKRRLAA